MVSRVLALFVALTTGAVGVLPSVAWHRCLWTHERMAPQHECDSERNVEDAPLVVTAPCCEQVAAVMLESRATTAAPEHMISPPTVVATLAFAPLGPRDPFGTVLPAASSRGRPPGDPLDRFSSILRI